MRCIYCPRPINPSTDEFEEVGSIEFAHVECKEKVEERERVKDAGSHDSHTRKESQVFGRSA